MAFLKLTPITRKRLEAFKRNKRAYGAFWIFLMVFGISLLTEFIANDKPIVVYHKGHVYFPFLFFYPETQFGGEFEIEANFKDPYVVQLVQKEGWMIMPPIPYSYDTVNHGLSVPAPSPPSWENLLGTDDQGRDLLARLLYGYRLSILFGLILAFFSSVLGIVAGGLQGYFGGAVDLIFQRFIEIWSGLPVLYLLIIMGSLVDPSFFWLLGLMVLFSWMALVNVVRAEFLRARTLDYVKAAQALGLSTPRILFRHILPNALISSFTFLPFIINGSIGTLTSLDFLGFGLPPGSPSLGEMIAQGKNNLHAPWLGITAFVSISLLLSLLVFIGEGVRDAFDPRRKVF